MVVSTATPTAISRSLRRVSSGIDAVGGCRPVRPAHLLEDEDTVEADDLPLLLDLLLRHVTQPIFDHSVEKLRHNARLPRILLWAWIRDLLVKVLMKVDLLLEDKAKLFSDFDEGVEWHQVLVHVENVPRLLLLSNSIRQIKVVL